MPAPPTTHQLRVRYSECDAQGIVFNARWFEYFDVAVNEFWREAIGGYNHLPEKFGVENVVAEAGARFRGAARYDDVLELVVHLRRIGTSSIRIEIDALRDGELLCEGFLEYVFVDAKSFQPVEIPDMVRNMLPEPPATD